MKISTKSLKAIEAVLDVAMLGALKPITLAEIGRHRRISLSYLEQMFRKLREHGLVRSTRGPGGGYRLNRRLSAISIADIVSAVDGAAPGRDPEQKRGPGIEYSSSPTRSLWSGLNDHLNDYLRSVTLESLLDEALKEERANAMPMPATAMAVPKSPAPATRATAVAA